MKLIKDELYASLLGASQNYNAILAAVRDADPELPENAGPEELIAALSAGSPVSTDQIQTLQQTIQAQTQEIATLKATIAQNLEQIKTLSGTPATPSPKIDAKEEPVATEQPEDEIKAINDKHADDPVALMAAMKEAGLV